MSDDAQPGSLFSEVHLPKLQEVSDDPRARRRIVAIFRDLLSKDEWFKAANGIKRRLGIIVPYGSGTMGIYHEWEDYFDKVAIADLLDSITVIFRVINSHKRERWRREIERIFRQQALAYQVDAHCGVRMYVDAEFANSHSIVLKQLALDRHKVALGHFRDFEKCLYGEPADFRGALRHLFETTEDVFKRISDGKESRLDPNSAKRRMTSIVESHFDDEELNALRQLVSGFASWVTAISQYRHAAGGPVIPAPSRLSATAIISVGFSYLRWLLQLDCDHLNPKNEQQNSD